MSFSDFLNIDNKNDPNTSKLDFYQKVYNQQFERQEGTIEEDRILFEDGAIDSIEINYSDWSNL